MRYALVIDLARCIGCMTCSVACKLENNLPDGTWWNRVLTVGGASMDTAGGRFPTSTLSYLPIQCQHCENPPCVKACPVGATYQGAGGIVLQDYDRCIGCRTCMMACPYSARTFNMKKPAYSVDVKLGDAMVPEHQRGVVEKCTLCFHRLARGEQPACAGDICPARARLFGDLDNPYSEVSKILHKRPFTRLHEDKGTSPRIYYLK